VVSAEGSHVGISLVELAVLSSEPSVRHVDVRVSSSSIDVVVKLLSWACPAHLKVRAWAAEDSTLGCLCWSIRCCIATIVETDISVSTSSVCVVNASFSSCCQDAH